MTLSKVLWGIFCSFCGAVSFGVALPRDTPGAGQAS